MMAPTRHWLLRLCALVVLLLMLMLMLMLVMGFIRGAGHRLEHLLLLLLTAWTAITLEGSPWHEARDSDHDWEKGESWEASILLLLLLAFTAGLLLLLLAIPTRLLLLLAVPTRLLLLRLLLSGLLLFLMSGHDNVGFCFLLGVEGYSLAQASGRLWQHCRHRLRREDGWQL